MCFSSRFTRSIPGFVCATALACFAVPLRAGVNVAVPSAPVVDQTTILSGSPPTSAFEDRVFRGSSGESRSQYEFPLPALPAGSIINSIQFNTFISGFQSSGIGIFPNVAFYGYSGNGVYGAGDAAVLSNQVGQTGLVSAGGASTFTFNSAANSILTGGASHLGLNLYAQNTDMYTAFVKPGTYANLPNLTVNANIPFAGTIAAKPTFDQKAVSPTSSSFTLTEGETAINTQYVPQASVDRRGIIEFDLAAIPTTATLSNATIQFYVSSLTSNSNGDYPQPLIYGYAGNALADASDATRTATLLATAPNVTGTGLFTINLNAAQIQSLRAQSPYLGIMVRGSENGQQFGFDTREGFGGAPTLNFDYAIPEPATMMMLIPILGGWVVRRRR
jgi:hypothetical protein